MARDFGPGPSLIGEVRTAHMIKLDTLSIQQPFRIDELVRAPAPDGGDGMWHRYVISQGTNTIAGLRAGKHVDVLSQIETMVERLNQRRMGKRPR